MGPSGVTIGGDDHALAGGQTVVLDHPGLLARGRTESIERRVQLCGVVDGLAGRRTDSGRRHHVFGEGLGALDARRIPRGAEARDALRAHRVGDAEHQGHLRADHHQIGAELFGQRGHILRGGDVDVVLLGDPGGAGVARRDGQLFDRGVLAQGEQEGVFAGT